MMEATRIKAVAFDAFGTLVEIGDPRRPYLRIARQSALSSLPSAMAERLDLATFAQRCGVRLLPRHEADLAAELASVVLFPESRDVLHRLRLRGYRIAIASNLALPYAAPIRTLLGDCLDIFCLSFDVGAVKPDAAFYRALCRQLDLAPPEILMVGNSWRSDYRGARQAGLQALHLDRRGTGGARREVATVTDFRQLLAILPA